MEFRSSSMNFREKHLFYRRWLNVNDSTSSQRYFSIRLVSYNILADDLMKETSFLYRNSSRTNLFWDRRRERLIAELYRQNADIVCLQEMQENHFYDEFQPRLADFGYASIYVKRPRDRPDGCAIFYKIDRFELIRSHAISFYQPDDPLLQKNNCGLIALFRPKIRQATSNDLFCVATTHLLFSSKRQEIRFRQLEYFLEQIDQLTMKNSDENQHFPLILCGDFNSTPDSPSIQYVLRDSSTNANDANKMNQFLSVYNLNDWRQISSNVDGELRLVDYIFYRGNSEQLTLLERYEMYSCDDVFDTFLPNHQFASDHFMIGAKFAFRLISL